MSRTVLVCQHQTCPQQGSAAVLKALQTQVPPDVEVKSSGCLGECGNGPMLLILPDQTWYAHVQVEDIPQIVEQHLQHGQPVTAKLDRTHHPTAPNPHLWLIITGLTLAAIALFIGFLANQTDYL